MLGIGCDSRQLQHKNVRFRIHGSSAYRPDRITNHDHGGHDAKRRQMFAERQIADARLIILHLLLFGTGHIGKAIVVEVACQCRHPLIREMRCGGFGGRLWYNKQIVSVWMATRCTNYSTGFIVLWQQDRAAFQIKRSSVDFSGQDFRISQIQSDTLRIWGVQHIISSPDGHDDFNDAKNAGAGHHLGGTTTIRNYLKLQMQGIQ